MSLIKNGKATVWEEVCSPARLVGDGEGNWLQTYRLPCVQWNEGTLGYRAHIQSSDVDIAAAILNHFSPPVSCSEFSMIVEEFECLLPDSVPRASVLPGAICLLAELCLDNPIGEQEFYWCDESIVSNDLLASLEVNSVDVGHRGKLVLNEESQLPEREYSWISASVTGYKKTKSRHLSKSEYGERWLETQISPAVANTKDVVFLYGVGNLVSDRFRENVCAYEEFVFKTVELDWSDYDWFEEEVAHPT